MSHRVQSGRKVSDHECQGKDIPRTETSHSFQLDNQLQTGTPIAITLDRNTANHSIPESSLPGPDTADSSSARVLSTPLLITTHTALAEHCLRLADMPQAFAVEFTNTHIVTLRRHNHAYRQLTCCYDYFIPDATPLIWCLNRQGAGLLDRVYGPSFMRHFLTTSPPECRHYFLGGSTECGQRLRTTARGWNPELQIVGSAHDRCLPDGLLADGGEERVMEELHRLQPDIVWIGLGTPKQDAWVHCHKRLLSRGVLLSVGFAFDVNAGTKPDAPPWMQRAGLTWLYRLASEPRRLIGRYAKYNSLFLWYLLWDGLHGRAFSHIKRDSPSSR